MPFHTLAWAMVGHDDLYEHDRGLSVLVALADEKSPVSQRRFTTLCGTTPKPAENIRERLRAWGFIHVERTEKNGPAKPLFISLTPKGRRVAHLLRMAQDEAARAVGMSHAEGDAHSSG